MTFDRMNADDFKRLHGREDGYHDGTCAAGHRVQMPAGTLLDGCSRMVGRGKAKRRCGARIVFSNWRTKK